MQCDSLPSFCTLLKERNELNCKFDITPTPDSEGVQVSFRNSIKDGLKMSSSDPELHLHPIKIKFSGDGTWLGKRLHVVNFCYTILNEERKAMSERGNYCLAIVKCKEDYGNLEASLADIIREMEETQSVDGER